MGEKTSFSCVKYIFFGFNVFIWLLGCGVLSLGVCFQINHSPQLAYTQVSLCTQQLMHALFFQLLGCGVLSLGVWLQINRSPHISILPTHAFLSASALCITAGAIILLVGFLGCCGAFYENQCMLIGYFIMVLLIFTLEITAGALGFLHKDELRSVIEKDLLTSIQQDYKTVSHPSGPSNQRSPSRSRDPEEWWLVMDSLQVELQCCGVNNYSDWF
ncbi:hypothetical protein V1264_024986, partial [Littorina saxatilis]